MENTAEGFVVGFAFSETAGSVLLINKLRPEWQRGLLNGIGGKIEEGETSLGAMHRECEEETGLSLNWLHKGVMQGKSSAVEGYTADDGHTFQCYIYYAYSPDIFSFKQIEDEVLGIYNPQRIDHLLVVENLKFLIPFGMYSRDVFMSLDYQQIRSWYD